MVKRRKVDSPVRKRVIRALFVVALAMLIVIARLVVDVGPERSPSDRYVIWKIIDGDTVELLGGDRLRLLAVDTPEKGEPFHKEATELLGRLTLGKTAVIKFGGKRRDKYGRLLGYLYIDSLFINKAIIDSGMGYIYLFRDSELHAPPVVEMLAAQHHAIAFGEGLWSIKHEPEEYYCSPVGSFRLHRPGCRMISATSPERLRKFTSREEGLLLGLSPCRNCRP